MKLNFASDNYAPVHSEVFRFLENVNQNSVPSYGNDEFTLEAEELFKEHFGETANVFFVTNGTGANVTGLGAVLKSYEAVICSELSHLNEDECGAFQALTGSKLLTVPTVDGKISIDKISPLLKRVGDVHRSQAKVISITQPTEYGTVYSVSEIQALADFAHQNKMYLHVDGARLSNAVVTLGKSFKEVTTDLGVDLLSFGGTKNGLMMGEAVVFLNEHLGIDYPFFRKQQMQLVSKHRFLSAQFIPFFQNQLWKEMARQANDLALILSEGLAEMDCFQLTQKTEANAVFGILNKDFQTKLLEDIHFYEWNEFTHEIRLMTNFTTTEADVNFLLEKVKGLINEVQVG